MSVDVEIEGVPFFFWTISRKTNKKHDTGVSVEAEEGVETAEAAREKQEVGECTEHQETEETVAVEVGEREREVTERNL
jgi:hypothetical protein